MSAPPIIATVKNEAQTSLNEIESKKLLKQAGINALETKLASFAEQHPKVKEIDPNPIYTYNDDAIAIDTRIILES